MRNCLIAVTVLLTIAPTALQGQKRCVKGIPCGNTCIAANKVCHVGQGTAVSARPSTQTKSSSPVGAMYPRTTCMVTEITDGDTFVCNKDVRVRLLLVDAPERDQGDFGTSARTALLELIPIGEIVELEFDVQKADRYGRTLAYVYRDRVQVNRAMARAGMALVAVYPPNVRYVEAIRAAADSAKAERVGLWSTSAFECTPADHRAKKCEP